MSWNAGLLPDLSPYVYGTTRLGDSSIPFETRVDVARTAIEAGVWIHTSHQYGDALKVLGTTIAQAPSRVPDAIFKIGWESVEQIRGQILEQLETVGMEQMAIGQLCLGGGIAESFRTGGKGIEDLHALKEEGIVGRYVLETWPWSSQVPIDAIRAGHASRLIDGLIFYLNPLQRFVTNDLWDLIQEQDIPIIAMRTVCGGSLQRLIDSPSAPDYLRGRASEVLPLYEQSGCANWTEFSVRFVYGFPQVRTTVGATSRIENLREFLVQTAAPKPLPTDIHERLVALQRKWSDEHDRHAAPWSM